MSEGRKRWLLCAAAALFGASLSRFGAAQSFTAAPSGTPCAGPEIKLAAPAADSAKWQTLRANLAEHLRPLRDLDRCAQLTLSVEGNTVLLEVRAGDGRLATRAVENEAQLLRASEALLTLPPKAPDSVLAPSPAEQPPSEPKAAASTPAAHVELGAGAAARLGGPPLFVAGGVAGFADLAVEPWILGVSARWELSTGLLSEPTLMDYYLMSTAVGVHVGRRFDVDGSSLDLLLGPNLVFEGQHADDSDRDIGGSAADVRIDLGARLSRAGRSRVRAFASADLELSPARLVKEHFAHPSLPPLPAFSFGLALGVLWRGN